MDTLTAHFITLINSDLQEITCFTCGNYLMGSYLYDIDYERVLCGTQCHLDAIECGL